MPNKRRRIRATASRSARLTSPSYTPLDHPAGLPRRFSAVYGLDDPFVQPVPVRGTVRPLIRTVLVERSSPAPRLRGLRPSPVLRSRASARSSQVRVRSPFLNATMVSPELTRRSVECAKRGIRREVLFALRRTGKGARSPRRSPSKWRC